MFKVMKARKLLAIGIITLLFMEFTFLTFSFLFPSVNEHSKSKEFLGDPSIELQIRSNSENVFEMYSTFNPNFAPLRIVTLIGQNDPNYDANFAYLAAIPIALYNENRILKVSPILYDDLGLAAENFLTDWKNYCRKFDSWNGIKNIVYIGNVSSQAKNQAEDLLNPEMILSPAIQPKQGVQILGSNIYDLAAQIATYFWYRNDTAVIAPIAETFPSPHSTVLNYSDSIIGIQWINKTGEINQTNLVDFWSKNDLSINSGAVLIQINNVNDLAMELFGNFTQPVPWMYDTNVLSKKNWVFFPNVSHPADLSEWGVKIFNRSQISSPISYNIAFNNLTYQKYQFEITNSESLCQISLNWSDPGDDLKFWVLDPMGQLVGASTRRLYESGETNKSSTIVYPAMGNWTIIVTRTLGNTPVNYDLIINVTEFSTYRRQCIESAANGAILASLLNKPLLYVTNTTVPNETKAALTTLNVTKVIRVDPFNLMIEKVSRDLKNLTTYLNEITNLTSRTLLYDFIFNISQESDLVLSSVNDGYFAPASLLAAFHGAPLLFTLNDSHNIHAGALENYAMESWVGFQNPGNSALLNQSIPRFEDMKGLADVYYTWMNTMNLDKPGNETVLVVSPLWELNPFFDRAIYGRSLVGRFAALNAEDLAAFICRNVLYPAFSYSNLSHSYELQDKITSSGGNSTITPTIPLFSGGTGNYTNCQSNDGVYHSYYNGSGGLIVMPYYVNLSDSQILFNNISQVEITIDGKIGYSNASIQVAGWGIWNWTSGVYELIDTQVLNSTTDQTDTVLINSQNKTDLIFPTNSRIEIFVLVNATGSLVNASIDFIQFNITYYQIINLPLMLSSSISYWHNFNYQGTLFNYSSLIPLNFTQAGYLVENATGYQEIYSGLINNCKFWYYSGNNTLNESGSQIDWNMLFTENNFWRAYGDYNDNQGSDPNNPDADGDNYVTANDTLAKWQTRAEIYSGLSYLPSTFILLQESYGAFTLIPEYLIAHGAATVIADLKENSLGYSEHFSYLTINELLKNKPLGEAIFYAFNQSSHLYSQDWEGNIIGTDPFSNYTEETQAFIIYGDPELLLINRTFTLVQPTSYRPLIHEFAPFTYRSTAAPVWANITDLDSDLRSEVFVEYSVLDTDDLRFRKDYKAKFEGTDVLFGNLSRFLNISETFREPLGNKMIRWEIFDGINLIQLDVPILLRSNPPLVSPAFTVIKLNDTGIYNDLSHADHDTLGRVNESISVEIIIIDSDHLINTSDSVEYNITLYLRNVDNNSSLSFSMNFIPDVTELDGYTTWNYTYQFDAFDSPGEYWIYIRGEDFFGEGNETYFDYFHVINWPPEPIGTNFVLTNGTGLEQRVYRKNETLEFYGAVLDVDGNQTHVQNVTMCFYKSPNQWINVTMSDADLNNNWTGTYLFTPLNESGAWDLFLKVTDKDNITVLFDPNVNVTVMNHPPDQPFNVTMRDFNLTDITSILRNDTVQFHGNATDFDILNRTAALSLYAVLRDPTGIVRYEEVMTYSNLTRLWGYNFTPQKTDPIGNWTFYVSVVDDANARTNSTGLNLTILNNMPIIQTVNMVPTSSELYIGEDLFITGTVIDVESLANVTVFIEDDDGQIINGTAILSGQSFDFEVKFEEANYTALKDTGTWNITIRLYDADGGNTGEFSFGAENNSITIIVRPRQTDGGGRFPIEIVIAIAIVVTAVLATFLVYRTRKKEAAVVPAARVKQIIKKISKEKKDTLTKARADIKARIKAIEPKPSPQVTILPEKKMELSEEERDNLNKEMRKLVKEAQSLLDKNQFEAAAVAYHDASKLATKLEKHEIAKVYLGRGEEILEKKSELKKQAKREAKEEKKKLKPKEKVSRAEVEQIKADIGEIMRSARMAIREEDYISAAKQYREVADLYRKIGDEDKAKDFEEKADDLL